MNPVGFNASLVIPVTMVGMLMVSVSSFDAHAACVDPPPPPTCDVEGQFIGGRWDLSQLSGQYSVSGSESFRPFIDDSLTDEYQTSGSLSVTLLGGSQDNYVDVACDGSVTGRGRERISGSLTKSPNIWYYNPDTCIGFPATMSWSLDIERSYLISGSVSGSGQLDLTYEVDSASLDFQGLMAQSYDCVFISAQRSFVLDIHGDSEQVRLAGGYDPDAGTFSPTITHIGGKSWLDAALHGIALNQTHDFDESTIQLAPSFQGAGAAQSMPQTYNQYLAQNGITLSATLQASAEPKQPKIELMRLQAPAQYLRDVSVDTEVEVEIDWRGKPPGSVEFTYGTQSATVAGSNVVTWTFDAGDEADTITAVARQGSEESLPHTINAPKVSVPEWAGSAADWSGNPAFAMRPRLIGRCRWRPRARWIRSRCSRDCGVSVVEPVLRWKRKRGRTAVRERGVCKPRWTFERLARVPIYASTAATRPRCLAMRCKRRAMPRHSFRVCDGSAP